MNNNKLTLFKNKKAGQPIKKKDGSVLEFNGKVINEPELRGYINITADNLEKGEYEVGVYKTTSKNGVVYYSGKIKPAYKQKQESVKPIDNHNITKGNGYQPDNIIDDEVPF